MSSKKIISIILPAYNEEAAISKVLKDVFKNIDDSSEVIVVDDGSTDRTSSIAADFPCRVIGLHKNQGKGAAVKAGIREAEGKKIIFMDADATYPASAIPEIVSALDRYDFVKGVRITSKKNMPLVNSLGNIIFNQLLKLAHGLHGADHLTGLYGLSRPALEKLELESDGFDLEVEINIKAQANNFKTSSIAIEYQERLGDKKLNPVIDGLKILSRIIQLLFVINPVLMFIIPGLVFCALGLGGALLLNAGPVHIGRVGFDTNSLLLMTLGFLAATQLVILGIFASILATQQFKTIPPKWLRVISSAVICRVLILFGSVIFSIAFFNTVMIVANWFLDGAGAFLETKRLLFNSALLVFGLQITTGFIVAHLFSNRFIGAYYEK